MYRRRITITGPADKMYVSTPEGKGIFRRLFINESILLIFRIMFPGFIHATLGFKSDTTLEFNVIFDSFEHAEQFNNVDWNQIPNLFLTPTSGQEMKDYMLAHGITETFDILPA